VRQRKTERLRERERIKDRKENKRKKGKNSKIFRVKYVERLLIFILHVRIYI